MKALKLIFIHTYYVILELSRQPMYLISTILFPAMFFWFFGIPNAKDQAAIGLLTGSFSTFGVLGVVLFQFGVGIAQDKETPWYSYVKILPSPRGVVIFSRILSGLMFSVLAVGGVLFTAFLFSDLDWGLYDWPRFFTALYLGAIPFGLMGICMGLLLSSKASLPVANLVYLPLSFAGGLWLPPNILPEAVKKISPYLPTRMYGEWVWSTLFKSEVEARYSGGLMIYALLFGTLALYLSKREMDRNFR